VVTTEQVRAFAATLPTSYEAIVRDRLKFRVGRIVYAAFSRDESILGVGFPKEERLSAVAAEPLKFVLPGRADLRYNWICVRMTALDEAEMRELMLDAWCMCVSRRRATEHLRSLGLLPDAAIPAGTIRPSRHHPR
jgi:hypothetical protein